MTETAWIALVAVVALSLASMTVRGVTRYRGIELAAYLVSVVIVGGLGASIAGAIDESHVALGLAIGVGLVELGPTVSAAGRRWVRARAKRLEGE